MDFLTYISNKLNLGEFIENIKPDTNNMLTGLTGSTISLFALDALNKTNKKIVIVENTNFHANKLFDDLNLVDSNRIHIFPVEEAISTEIATSSPDELSQRIDALTFLLNDQPGILVTSTSGIEYTLSAKELFKASQLKIVKDD